MSHAVVDASALVSALTNTDASALIPLLANVRMHAPHVVDLEVASALRRLEKGSLSAEVTKNALHSFSELTIARYDHQPLVREIWSLRDNFSPYDAAYVVLAKGLAVPLITRDARLAKAAGRYVDVTVA